ncbi:hypothetical protein BDV96DRAFT_652386 [Lophiotrema nucula]|uniref:Uncharacterized protein n=1 Tax=Lophiotrema nucula TaxID=690887 RepID=A0A6A5YNX3_9PLEO|nr:hypothetical protein BDV96DRAFT_652386 [Lophiotrema nucula]
MGMTASARKAPVTAKMSRKGLPKPTTPMRPRSTKHGGTPEKAILIDSDEVTVTDQRYGPTQRTISLTSPNLSTFKYESPSKLRIHKNNAAFDYTRQQGFTLKREQRRKGRSGSVEYIGRNRGDLQRVMNSFGFLVQVPDPPTKRTKQAADDTSSSDVFRTKATLVIDKQAFIRPMSRPERSRKVTTPQKPSLKRENPFDDPSIYMDTDTPDESPAPRKVPRQRQPKQSANAKQAPKKSTCKPASKSRSNSTKAMPAPQSRANIGKKRQPTVSAPIYRKMSISKQMRDFIEIEPELIEIDSEEDYDDQDCSDACSDSVSEDLEWDDYDRDLAIDMKRPFSFKETAKHDGMCMGAFTDDVDMDDADDEWV